MLYTEELRTPVSHISMWHCICLRLKLYMFIFILTSLSVFMICMFVFLPDECVICMFVFMCSVGETFYTGANINEFTRTLLLELCRAQTGSYWARVSQWDTRIHQASKTRLLLTKHFTRTIQITPRIPLCQR